MPLVLSGHQTWGFQVHRCSIVATTQRRAERTEGEIDFVFSIHISERGLICLQTINSQIVFKKNLNWDHRI